ncbi:MAG: HPr family phosphocarrier protein [Aeoliella sp.]
MAESVVTQTFVVSAEHGLHLRPAEQLARLAGRYASQIGLVYQSQRVDAKSIMEMLTLGASKGASVVVEARGCDAADAVEAIMALASNDFSSEEDSTSTT